MLATTLAAPVLPWYLIPCLVLSVELRDAVWQAWLLRFGTLSLLADGSLLFAYGSSSRAAYTAVSVPLVAGRACSRSARGSGIFCAPRSPCRAAVERLIGSCADAGINPPSPRSAPDSPSPLS